MGLEYHLHLFLFLSFLSFPIIPLLFFSPVTDQGPSRNIRLEAE